VLQSHCAAVTLFSSHTVLQSHSLAVTVCSCHTVRRIHLEEHDL